MRQIIVECLSATDFRTHDDVPVGYAMDNITHPAIVRDDQIASIYLGTLISEEHTEDHVHIYRSVTAAEDTALGAAIDRFLENFSTIDEIFKEISPLKEDNYTYLHKSVSLTDLNRIEFLRIEPEEGEPFNQAVIPTGHHCLHCGMQTVVQESGSGMPYVRCWCVMCKAEFIFRELTYYENAKKRITVNRNLSYGGQS